MWLCAALTGTGTFFYSIICLDKIRKTNIFSVLYTIACPLTETLSRCLNKLFLVSPPTNQSVSPVLQSPLWRCHIQHEMTAIRLHSWLSSLCCALLWQHGIQLTLCCCCGCTRLSSVRSISEETNTHTKHKITKCYGHLSKPILGMSRRVKWVDAFRAVDVLPLSAAACDLLRSISEAPGVENAPTMATVNLGDDLL